VRGLLQSVGILCPVEELVEQASHPHTSHPTSALHRCSINESIACIP
jgi:hypothetical protein